jgi:predicted 3-demethylubiquinone-9 3-methyltransferase (glyoxalase superfamily)
MPITARKITPCLWFDGQAEDAATMYVAIFRDARILRTSHYGKEGHDIHGREAGSVMTVEFEIEGQRFVAMNGGPLFKFNEAVSFQVNCETQEEIDDYWGKLTEHGEEGPCGWLKDRYGLSWQIVPSILPTMLMDPDPEKAGRGIPSDAKIRHRSAGAGVQGRRFVTITDTNPDFVEVYGEEFDPVRLQGVIEVRVPLAH